MLITPSKHIWKSDERLHFLRWYIITISLHFQWSLQLLPTLFRCYHILWNSFLKHSLPQVISFSSVESFFVIYECNKRWESVLFLKYLNLCGCTVCMGAGSSENDLFFHYESFINFFIYCSYTNFQTKVEKVNSSINIVVVSVSFQVRNRF